MLCLIEASPVPSPFISPLSSAVSTGRPWPRGKGQEQPGRWW